MAATPRQDDAIISGINVTPLVDITLVLLIIFIVTAKLIVAPALPLDLPRASQAQAQQVVFSVSIPANEALSVNGETVTDDRQLMRLAKDALVREAALRAVIAADGAVPHRRVIHVLDLLQSAGVQRVAFGALPAEPVDP